MHKTKFLPILLFIAMIFAVKYLNVSASNYENESIKIQLPYRMPDFKLYIGKLYTNFVLPKPNDKPLVIAHRGGADLYPENTMVAIDGAVSMGVDLIELDICLTKDNVLVLNHDKRIERVSDGQGAINDYTFEELKNYNFGFNFKNLSGDYPYKENKVPITTLEDVFKKYPETRFIIELKDTDVLGQNASIALYNLIRKYDEGNRILVTSIDYNVLDYFNHICRSNIYTGFISTNDKNCHDWIKNYLFRYDNTNLTPEKISDMKTTYEGYHKKGIPIYYWTINDVESMKELVNYKIDGIITDRPDLLVELLKNPQ